MQPKPFSFKNILVLVLILALPGFLYYLLTVEGKNRYKPLPFFGPKLVAKTSHKFHGKIIPDTIYHQVANFELTDQDGQKVSLVDYKEKVVVVNFFYTRCPSLCTIINKNIALLAKDYSKNKMIRFISITVDPQFDNSSVLKNYASQFGVSNAKWRFLTGDTAAVYNLARNSFLVNALKLGDKDFAYSEKVILMDAEHRIRGYYTGTSVPEMTTLNDEIKVQIAEELRKIKAPEM
jgi:protein SCO1/2